MKNLKNAAQTVWTW